MGRGPPGAGSTWSSNALDQWRRNVVGLYGITVNFAPTGSTTGRNDFRAGLTDFAVSEIPYGLNDGGVIDNPPKRRPKRSRRVCPSSLFRTPARARSPTSSTPTPATRPSRWPRCSTRRTTYVEPTAGSVAVALLNARIAPDLTQDLSQVYINSDPRTYPLSSYSYMIISKDTTSTFSNEKGATLSEFAAYFLCEGQQQADALGYSPLPINLVQAGVDQVNQIPNSTRKLNRDDLRRCNNPAVSPDGGNLVARNAPQPSPGDLKGAPAQCTTGTGGAPAPTPVSGGRATSAGGGGPGGGVPGSGTGGAAPPPGSVVSAVQVSVGVADNRRQLLFAALTSDSRATVSGTGAFSGLTVTVSQTKNLINQAITVSWTGGHPTLPSGGDFGVNYLQIMQCWGDDPNGPDRTQCQYGALGGDSPAAGSYVRSRPGLW
jgi:PBP superfamily domain